MNGTELRSFSNFQILTKIAYTDLRTKLDDWLILEFFFIYCKTVQFNKDDQYPMETRFTSVFLMNGTELKSLSYFQIFTKITYPDLRTKLDNWLILEFFFISCKSVQFNQDDQYQMETRFTSVFLMNGTELKSLSYFQIFTKITYPDLRTKLDNWLILEFFFIYCKTVQFNQDDQYLMETRFTIVFLMNGTELRSFSLFWNFEKIVYPDLRKNLIID